MDSIKNAAENKLGKDSQPGNNVERSADNAVNEQVDNAAGQAGVPGSANNTINDAVDKKVNEEIPGGN
ncbi:hypothetical protein Daus18300_002973 [Diaporthe australafricana]|uniref:Uncharacterized protein n=1 Tax=Diaporthe australafricana TaxID=127596 RepID=A0ABR3XJU5_9PEZI